jgi:hypothetical protein
MYPLCITSRSKRLPQRPSLKSGCQSSVNTRHAFGQREHVVDDREDGGRRRGRAGGYLSGRNMTCPSHSSSMLHSTISNISSTAWLIGTSLLTRNTPGISKPAAIRSYAYCFIVLTSCVNKTRPSVAAHSNISASPLPRSPTSCTRTMSSSGLRCNSPRRIRLSKFSSVADGSISYISFIASLQKRKARQSQRAFIAQLENRRAY